MPTSALYATCVLKQPAVSAKHASIIFISNRNVADTFRVFSALLKKAVQSWPVTLLHDLQKDNIDSLH